MVCSLCHAPFTGNLTTVFETWQRFEGGDAAYNPLNTELVMRGSRPYNTAGVQSYVSAASGASATAQTLMNGRYNAILAAMRANTPIDSWSVAPIPAEIDTWGTHGFAAYLRQLTPAQEDDVTPQLAQMIVDIWDALFGPVPIFGGEGVAKPNNLDIVRRAVSPYNAGYPVASPPPGTPPPPLARLR